MYKRKLIKDLINWKNSPTRKPLILRGARQVGKTTLIEMFSSEFDNFIHLNLDKQKDLEVFEQNNDVQKIIQILFLRQNIVLKSNASVLVFIDEVQNSPQAVWLLRYFYEEANHIYIIAAGSLLENILDNQISYPVGRVEFLILRPFNFQEFLMAKGNAAAYDLWSTVPFPEYAHQELLELFTEYSLIGGMPEIVKIYLETGDLVLAGRAFESLIAAYLEDVEKYSKNPRQANIIRFLITTAFKYAGERIKFEGFGNSNYKSGDIGECFRILEKTFLLSLIYPTTGTSLPIRESFRKSPRLQLVDTGIINKITGIQSQILENDFIDNIYEGKLAEHIVGQEILSLQNNVLAKNCFWVKEKKQSSAEVDYALQMKNYLIPVEVKLGKTGRLRSLMEFIDLAPHNYAIRIYSGNLRFEKVTSLKGKEFYLLNLPFYLTGKIYEYFDFMIDKIKQVEGI
ncbi:MAG: ATP-binding protein [Actinobacteria bacterium]|nr:ATP-binding protein [Actinomycetota bacterium]